MEVGEGMIVGVGGGGEIVCVGVGIVGGLEVQATSKIKLMMNSDFFILGPLDLNMVMKDKGYYKRCWKREIA